MGDRLVRSLLLLLAVVAVACGRSESTGGGAAAGGESLLVLAASSLDPAFGRLAEAAPGLRVTVSFAGSARLAAQVEAGAPADVVATADAVSMAELVGAGLVEAPQDFATNRLTIAVPPGNPKGVRGLADLSRADLQVVLADPSVPAGRYGRHALERAGVAVRPVSLELDVRSAAAKVASGEADAAIVYATDVPVGAQVPIPEVSNVAATYSVAVVRGTPLAGAAQAFVDRLLGPRGRDILLARGFGIP